MNSFTIGGNLAGHERLKAVLTPYGGCVESLNLCVDGAQFHEVWAKRLGPAPYSNGQFLGYCGLHTDFTGRGGLGFAHPLRQKGTNRPWKVTSNA